MSRRPVAGFPVALAAALAAGAASAAGATPAPERVRIPADKVVLAGALFKPAGPGPFPAVVALHGCGGLFLRDGRLDSRSADWADLLVAQGFAVLFPDSFGPRGLGPQCRTADRRVRASRERVADAHAARRFLQAQPFVKADAVSLVGWSNGGTTVLHAAASGAQARAATVPGPDFRAAIAFYPGCRTLAARPYAPRIPLTILVGEADDWTGADPCRALAAASPEVKLVTYAGAVHGFDQPDQPVTVARGLAFTASGTGEARTGTDPAARADARARLPGLLAR